MATWVGRGFVRAVCDSAKVRVCGPQANGSAERRPTRAGSPCWSGATPLPPAATEEGLNPGNQEGEGKPGEVLAARHPALAAIFVGT